MILTCKQCETQYKLEPEKLGTGGRTVRCIGCNHTWFQMPPEQQGSAPAKVEKTESPAVQTAAPALPIKDALDALLEKDDAAFEAILSGTNAKQSAAADAASIRVSPVVRHETSPSVITHNPMGVGAAVFGALTFLLCVSFTLAGIFLFQKQILRHWPQMALLYQTIGFHPKAPGEGLRISDVTAGLRVDKQGKVIVVEGKMTNISEHDIVSPPLYVLLKDEQAKVIKGWNLKMDTARLVSGEAVPLMMEISDAPPEGTAVEVRVKDE